MNLPKANISFDNGNLDTVVSSDDGVFGLLASSSAVADKFDLNKPYLIRGMKDVAALGITPTLDNYRLHKWLSDFYAEAGEGTKLWLMGRANTESVSSWFTPVSGVAPVDALADKANGEISAVFTCFSPEGSYTPTIANAVDNDVPLAIAAAQLWSKNYTENKMSPVFTVLEAYAFDGTVADLADLKQGSDNRVAVMIGSTESRTGTPASNGASTSVLAGRMASVRVSKNVGEVKAGALTNQTAFLVSKPIDEAMSDVETIHEKGYISFRTHIRKAGYYFTDSNMATADSDDYRSIENRRTIDKAFKIAHDVVSNEILTDFSVNNEGQVDFFYAQGIEAAVESAIALNMTSNSELSVNSLDENDQGVKAVMNKEKNVVNDSTLELSLKIRPRGYNRYFEVLLGFDVNLNN